MKLLTQTYTDTQIASDYGRRVAKAIVGEKVPAIDVIVYMQEIIRLSTIASCNEPDNASRFATALRKAEHLLGIARRVAKDTNGRGSIQFNRTINKP